MPEAESAARSRALPNGGRAGNAGDARAALSAARRRRHILIGAAYVIFGAALFLAFLAALFPYGDTISAMLKPLNLEMVYRDQRMHFPIGATLADVRLVSTAERPPRTLLRSPDMILAPTLASLLFGRPGLRVRAQIYGGSIGATLYQRNAVASIVFTANSLNLAQADPLLQAGAELGGAISAAGTAELAEDADWSGDTAHMALDGSGVSLKVVNGLPPIRLGAVAGVAALNDGVITLSNFETHGDDLEIAARGTIQLAPDPADTIVNMTVSLTPTPGGRNRFGVLLDMLPHPPARGPYYISGPLTAPSVN